MNDLNTPLNTFIAENSISTTAIQIVSTIIVIGLIYYYLKFNIYLIIVVIIGAQLASLKILNINIPFMQIFSTISSTTNEKINQLNPSVN